jgi:hypothetical protein
VVAAGLVEQEKARPSKRSDAGAGEPDGDKSEMDLRKPAGIAATMRLSLCG